MSKISNEQIQKICLDLNTWIKVDQKQRNNTLIGKATGYDGSTISLFRNGKYAGDVENVALKVQKFLEGQKQYGSFLTPQPLFAKTSAAEEVARTIDFVLTFNKIALIIGEAGGGKSISLNEYSKEQPNIIYLPIEPEITKRALIEMICRSLKINFDGESNISCFHSCVTALKDSARLMIFDEGEHLKVAQHEIIRRLQDFTCIPMILAGTETLENTLTGRRKNLKQLTSRIAMKTEIPLLNENDTKIILELNYPEAAKYYETFHLLCKRNGRYLENLCNLVRYAVMRANVQITEELIVECSDQLLPIKER
jgi:DNA transposition AAA+ family ATPase